jgi:hypothetical protein
LVGGGQEIHNGEAGLSEWGKTLKAHFPHWKVVVSPKVINPDESLAGHCLFEDRTPGPLEIKTESSLHLEVSLRSFRARKLTEWVEAVLALESTKATMIMRELTNFPIVLTRSLTRAREWLRTQTRGLQRCGLVASSGAVRLRADGIELSSGFRQGNRDMFVHWFLDRAPDVRSSNQLEVAASEFECQGLELDWVGVCWGGDLTFNTDTGAWNSHYFSGSRWGKVQKEIDRKYLLNTYRVLLTRARQGLVIWVPKGDSNDETRSPDPFDSTAKYIERCGLTLS